MICAVCGHTTYLAHIVTLVGNKEVIQEFICFMCGFWLCQFLDKDFERPHSVETMLKRSQGGSLMTHRVARSLISEHYLNEIRH